MAGKRNPLLKDYVKEDLHWKLYIRGSNESKKKWTYRWGWILDDYKALKVKMDEHTANSQMLKRIIAHKKEDKRRLGQYPLSTNHQYGYVAINPEMKLEKWGSDFFKPLPLPDLYKIFKGE